MFDLVLFLVSAINVCTIDEAAGSRFGAKYSVHFLMIYSRQKEHKTDHKSTAMQCKNNRANFWSGFHTFVLKKVEAKTICNPLPIAISEPLKSYDI